MVHAVVLAALLALAACTVPDQSGMQGERTFLPVGFDGGGGTGM